MNKEFANNLKLNDGLMTRLSPYLNEGMPNIFDYEYKTKVLGISGYINENSSIEEKRLVIEEYLLMENFWKNLASVPAGIAKMSKSLKKIIDNPNMIDKWIKAITDTKINNNKEKIIKFLENIILSSRKYKNETIFNTVSEVLKFFKEKIKSIEGLEGWKKAMSITGLALVIEFLMVKIKKYIGTSITDMGKNFLDIILKNNIINGLKTTVLEGLKSLVGSVISGGISTFLKIGIKLFSTVDFIINALKDAIELFNRDDSPFALWKDKFNENFIKPTKTKSLIKIALREGLSHKII
tara:strand:- start:1341 stop:2228 length:888 start_codon:yes stop_codon:yes gene_type:complete